MYMQWRLTPLWMASFEGHQKCAELLIEAGANVDVPVEVSMTCCARISCNVTTPPHDCSSHSDC